MWFGIVLFMTISISFKLTESLSSNERFNVQPERMMTGNLTSVIRIPARSRIECTVKCLENADCCMSSYNRDTNACTIDISGCCDVITGQADDTDIMIKLSAIRTFGNVYFVYLLYALMTAGKTKYFAFQLFNLGYICVW